MTRALVLALMLLACDNRNEGDVPTRVGEPPKPSDAIKPPAPPPTTASTPDPTTADELLRDAKQRAQAYDFSRFTIEYVSADGMLDPRYSKGTVVFTQDRPPPPDDPNRPTGAPISPTPRAPPRKCPAWTWEPGAWTSSPGPCSVAFIEAVRCPVVTIWQRAIADGAPPDALAKLTMVGRSPRTTGAPRWSFEIRDTVRGVQFSRSYADDCRPIAEAPDPSVPSDHALPANLDRTMITNAIGSAKPKITACQLVRARARVKLSVRVTPEGVATSTVKEATTPELGVCVAAVVDALTFPRTRSGGTFSYPFTF